ncbi:MAG: acetylornithine transaminase [Clostridia bacterium]|nr:acetylornithine transaminase [Clostridia bacterium]
MTTKELDAKYIMPTYARFPQEIVRGKGAELYDEAGKRYIDLGSGIAVNTFGAADDAWVSAVAQQAGRLAHASNLYYTGPCAELAAALCERTGMQKVFFSNSGAEANECMIKGARRHALHTRGEGHSTIITLRQSFHGRTVTTLAATGQDHFHTEFGPFTEGFVYATAGDREEMEALVRQHEPAGIMIELVQGEGGVIALDVEYVRFLRKLCNETGTLLLIDEVQTGNGRTGSLYAWQSYGVTPDIFSTAKGLAGGLPLGATLFSEKTEGALIAGTHGSTFGGNPICCAGALSVIGRLDDAFLAGVRARAEYIRRELSGAKGVADISGLGLMIGIEPEGKTAKEVIAACMERGVLVLSAKSRVRLLPPLNIDEKLLAEAIGILKEVLAQ